MAPTHSLGIHNLDRHLDELSEQGYTIIPGYLDRQTTAAIRAHIDAVVISDLPDEDLTWADTDKARIYRNDERGVRQLRHPIIGNIMPEIANNPQTIELGRFLLGSDLANLRMREQVLSRTDPTPPPYGPSGWHIDAPFTKEEYESTPRRIYYQLLQYCSTVESGGAAFMLVPGSHKLAYAANAEPRSEEQRQLLQKNPIGVARIDPDEGIEVCANDGDLIIFNAMCLHSASKNASQQTRYVYFTSFYDASAEWLVDYVRKTKYRDDFPDSLYRGLPEELHHLLAH